MKKLNQYQIQVIQKAIKEEAAKDIQIHAYPKHETAELFALYEKGDAVAAEALLSLFDFWACYFALGAETAFAIHEAERAAELEELEKRCAEIEARYVAELEDMLYGC